jgi:hypothetical protein
LRAGLVRQGRAGVRKVGCSGPQYHASGRMVVPWARRARIQEWRSEPGLVERGAGGGAFRARRKQAPKTSRASETRALRANRNLEGLFARDAARRARKAGHVRETVSESRSKSRAECREKVMPGSVGSRLVATGRIARDVFKTRVPSGHRSGQRGEANLENSDRCPPVVSENSRGEEVVRAAPGSPAVAGAESGSGSQKLTVTPRAMLEMGRVGAKARNSARQAGVRSSPILAAGMWAPTVVHPGQRP